MGKAKAKQEEGDEILRRMLKTPPKSGVNDPVTKTNDKEKPDDDPAKKRRPATKL